MSTAFAGSVVDMSDRANPRPAAAVKPAEELKGKKGAKGKAGPIGKKEDVRDEDFVDLGAAAFHVA